MGCFWRKDASSTTGLATTPTLPTSELTVVLIGDRQVGKSSLVLRWCQNSFYDEIKEKIDVQKKLVDLDGTLTEITVCYSTTSLIQLITKHKVHDGEADPKTEKYEQSFYRGFEFPPFVIISISL
eukprot:TRINITY_DN15340_c0_g1_i6.p1 TRINITY_DN15340_c0_g1~~TRINITY_DN15340_c0_g1_i6.p1  ORF type:complete len:125 (-),score=17.72 TRINITY_DN15340_c0_g1_i6:314-688(-)